MGYSSMKTYSSPIAKRRWLATAATAAAFCLCAIAPCFAERLGSRLTSQEELRNLGLTRAWFAQAQLDVARNHIERAVITGDRLTVLTSAGVMQEFNAETGETLWTAPIGNESYPSLGPTANDQYVALVNGSTLYILDRADGRPAMIISLSGAPGAAPALAEKYVFVPLVKGRMEGYPLSMDNKVKPWFYQSSGRTMVAPLATPESIVWTNNLGNLYVGNSQKPAMRYRLEMGGDIVASPAYAKPFVYVAGISGEVFAMHELTGDRHWKYATGFPIVRSPATVANRVFVTTDEPALHCVDAVTGNAFWHVPHVKQFSAASKTRVYGVDDLGGLVVLDGAKGALVGRIAADFPIKSLVNDQTDRVFLVSDDGLIECLHETAAKQPLHHILKPTSGEKPATPAETPAAKPAPAAKKPDQPPAAAKPAPPEKPAGDFGVKDSDNPFGN